MKLLSRSEEMVLLAVWKLQGEAYCVPIRSELMQITRKNWSFGSIYDPLERLERKKLLESHLTEPTRERGGRSKRIRSRLNSRSGSSGPFIPTRASTRTWVISVRYSPISRQSEARRLPYSGTGSRWSAPSRVSPRIGYIGA